MKEAKFIAKYLLSSGLTYSGIQSALGFAKAFIDQGTRPVEAAPWKTLFDEEVCSDFPSEEKSE